MEKSVEEFFHLGPTAAANSLQNSRKVKRYFFNDFIDFGNLVVNVKINETDVIFKKLIRDILGTIFWLILGIIIGWRILKKVEESTTDGK